MFSNTYSDRTLSLLLVLCAAAWGIYWYPLRSIEELGFSGSWSVAFFNACPLIILLPLLAFKYKQLTSVFWPTVLASSMIGLAFTFYANGLVETTVVRATMLYYLTPVWSTIIGVIWLSEPLTKARIIAIIVAFVGLFLLLTGGGESSDYPLNIGDLFSLLSGVFWGFGLAVLNRWANIRILPLATFIFLSTTTLSVVFAGVFYADPLPDTSMVSAAFPIAAFWSIVVLLPCFCIIFRISQVLFPGRVGILSMSEVVVAIISASILLPAENMLLIQWIGAAAIVLAGLVEVVFGYNKED